MRCAFIGQSFGKNDAEEESVIALGGEERKQLIVFINRKLGNPR